MKVKTLSLKHQIYNIHDVFTGDEFDSIRDEFSHGRWIFDKRERSLGTTDYPIRGLLETRNVRVNEGLDLIGHNNVLTNLAINAKYKIQQLIFDKKRVVVFALPGAFTPTCSSQQLPGYEEKCDEIKSTRSG